MSVSSHFLNIYLYKYTLSKIIIEFEKIYEFNLIIKIKNQYSSFVSLSIDN